MIFELEIITLQNDSVLKITSTLSWLYVNILIMFLKSIQLNVDHQRQEMLEYSLIGKGR